MYKKNVFIWNNLPVVETLFGGGTGAKTTLKIVLPDNLHYIKCINFQIME